MAARDNLLIAEFNAGRSEEAFAALVRLHVNLVFATALRLVGDRGMAEEVTQNVFIALAQSAGKLGRHPTIAGWLYQTTLNKARERMRSELRRQRREQVAINLELANAEGESVWTPLVPLLDEALLELRERDRLAVILHFMEGQTFREVGAALGVGEDATRKRVKACLDRLTLFFRRRGFAVPALVAGAPLFTLSSHAAPPGLAASVTVAGLSAAKVAGTSGLTLYSIMASTKIKIAVVVIIAAGVGTTIVLEKQSQTRLRNDNATLQQRVESLDRENQRLLSEASQSKPQRAAEAQTVVKPSRLSLADLPAAIQAALKKPIPQRAAAFKAIVDSINSTDCPAAAKLLAGHSNFEVRTTMRNLLLARWAETDVHAALAAAQASPTSDVRRNATLSVVAVWAKNDAASALAWAQNLPVSFDRNSAIQEIIASLVSTDPLKAAGLALEMPARWRNNAIAVVAREWASIDPDAEIAWLKTLTPGAAQNDALAACSEQLARANPAAAADLLSSIPPQPMRDNQQFADQIATYWAQDDLSGALAWAEQLHNVKERQVALKRICMEWVNTDPQAAAAYALKYPVVEHGTYFLANTVGCWAQNDPEAAIKWVSALTDEDIRRRALRGIALDWAQNSPADAARFVASLPTGKERNETAQEVASVWAQHDPQAAAGYASSLPDGPERATAFQNIVLEWGKNDFNATAEWLKTLPQGDSRDTAIVTFATNCLKDYAPSTALEWAQTITGDGVRNNIMRKIATEWLNSDQDAARAWIASSSLSDKMKNELLSRK